MMPAAPSKDLLTTSMAHEWLSGVARDFATKTEGACCWNVVKTKRSIQSTLHLLDGGDRAWGCNEAGEIVGDGNSQAVYWTHRDAVAQPLPAPPVERSTQRMQSAMMA